MSPKADRTLRRTIAVVGTLAFLAPLVAFVAEFHRLPHGGELWNWLFGWG